MSRKQGPHPYLLLLSMGQPSESRKRLKSLQHTAVITEDENGGVTRRTAEGKSSSTISSFLSTPANEKSFLTIYWPGVDLIIFG